MRRSRTFGRRIRPRCSSRTRRPASGKPFFVKSIWHDERYTYIKADARELPTLYEVTGDGAPALVNFQVENGTYVVPKVLERGYLALGGQKLEFQTREAKGR